LRGDYADNNRWFLPRNFNNMGVGDNFIRRNCKAAAVTNKGDLIPVFCGEYDTDNRATGGADVTA